MSTLADIIPWPETLPLPLVDYDGTPMHATIASTIDNPHILRRSRFSAAVINVSAHWVLNLAEYDIFQAFFTDDLGNGAAVFTLELLHPNSTLTIWKVRFTSGFVSDYQEGNWVVAASIDLIGPAEVEEASLPNASLFLVRPDNSPFVGADGYNYAVVE